MLVLCLVIGPPDGPCFAGSLRVRSGLITCQLWPSFADLKSTWAAMNRAFGLVGASTIGNVHWKRYLRAAAPQPMGLSGHAVTARACPVRRSKRVINALQLQPTTTSGSSERA